jgi:lipoprotein-anchoring transpeptidase ErfK/SrfK
MMKANWKTPLIALAVAAFLTSCQPAGNTPQQGAQPKPTTDVKVENQSQITLPAFDALFSDKIFTAALKSKVQLTDEQIAALKKVSSDELAKLRSTNAGNQTSGEEDARARVFKSIREMLGNDKADQLLAMALERRGDQMETAEAKDSEPSLLKGPNAVPPDTRIVVNIPAFRMDIFREGALLKSYKIGIGYQEYPLPTGFRKAEMIIFNPTWTQPNEPWASNPGLVVPAGDKGNPLGPIKIPIGGANLIHGGKVLAKIGTFASHGCVGLTNEQVKDFAKVLADGTNTELKEETILAYLKKRTRTQVVKLNKIVPVELRYETIVIQEGQLHVYRDVYNKKTNTEENLRAVFEANGVSFDTLTDEEKTQSLDAVNAMSLHPKKQPTPKPTVVANQNSADKRALAAERKAEAERLRKLRNQKEIVIEIASLNGKGYPAPKDLNTGAGTVTIDTPAPAPKLARPRRSPAPEPQSSPRMSPTPAPQSSPRMSPTPAPQPSPRTNPTPAPQSSPGGDQLLQNTAVRLQSFQSIQKCVRESLRPNVNDRVPCETARRLAGHA